MPKCIVSHISSRWRALLLAGIALVVCLASGGLDRGAVWAGTLPARLFQSPLPLVRDTSCLSHTDNGVVFDFMGYQTGTDDSTILTIRITNPHRQPAAMVTFTSAGWTRVAPAARSVYAGDTGSYRVQWFLHNATRRQQGFRFVGRGAHLRNGASETFRLTVRDFDPNAVVVAWVRAGRHVAEVQGRPAQHNCEIRPTPTATATPTATPTATATPVSPLPPPPPLPAHIPDVAVHILRDSDFEHELSLAENKRYGTRDCPRPIPNPLLPQKLRRDTSRGCWCPFLARPRRQQRGGLRCSTATSRLDFPPQGSTTTVNCVCVRRTPIPAMAYKSMPGATATPATIRKMSKTPAPVRPGPLPAAAMAAGPALV